MWIGARSMASVVGYKQALSNSRLRKTEEVIIFLAIRLNNICGSVDQESELRTRLYGYFKED